MLKIRVAIQKNLNCIAHARTKGVKNLKFSQNVHFGTTYLSQQTVFKSSAIGLRYLMVHIRRDTLYTCKNFNKFVTQNNLHIFVILQTLLKFKFQKVIEN